MSVVSPIHKVGRRVPKKIWEAIKYSYERDVSLEELELKYCVPMSHIESRASKEDWNRPKKLAKEVARQVDYVTKKLDLPPPKIDWADAALSHRARMLAKLNAAMDEMELEAPTNWRDAEIMDRMARKNLGIEEGDKTVVQNIIPIGHGSFGVERDVTPVEQ